MQRFKSLFEDNVEDHLNDPDFRIIFPNGINLENYRKCTETRLSHKDTVNRILNFMRRNNVSDADRVIFNKILGDNEILNKLVFITDASYRSHRLFCNKIYNESEYNWEITISDDSDEETSKYSDLLDTEKINYIKKHYELIFIQLADKNESRLYELGYPFSFMNDFPAFKQLMTKVL